MSETSRDATLEQARIYVRQELERESSGHDWWHIVRVARMAKRLAAGEQADVFVCELAALLHDVADEKLNPSKEAGLEKVEAWLGQAGVSAGDKAHVMGIISTMSYSGGHGKPMSTLEGRIVQDADRLDAIGAIGAARTFAYGGWKGRPMHNPEQAPREQLTAEQYRSEQGTAINHFYEKLLKLKGLMNTDTAREAAEERHRFMEFFLEQFYREWDAEEAGPNLRWLDWAKQIQAIAQTGLTYTKDVYDIERYEALREMSVDMMANHSLVGADRIRLTFASDTGYATPKVDVRGVVFEHGKILLVREKADGAWALPGGWADIGHSPSEVAVKEVREEAGYKVEPVKLLAVLDKKFHNHPPEPYHIYKIFILCTIVGGEAAGGVETSEAAFFGENELPELSVERNTAKQIRTMFEFLRNPDKQVILD